MKSVKNVLSAGSIISFLAKSNPALEEKGYDPINQIVGFLLSGDPAYIPRHNDARNLIRRFERDEIMEELLKSYLSIDESGH